jgi:hypothetical protein
MEAPMGLKPAFEERQTAAQADRHLDTANRCLVRQLRVLKTMLDTHETMVETHLLEA